MSSAKNWGALIGLSLSLSLSACGFQPLYATRADSPGVIAQLGSIAVSSSGGEEGRAVQLALEDRLLSQPGAAAQYSVRLASILSARDVAIQQDTEVTRKNLVLTVNYNLIDNESGEILVTRKATSYAAFNRVASEFANIIAERDAIDRAANKAADEIQQELAVYFNRTSG